MLMNPINIKEHGRFFQQNSLGELLNDCAITNLKSPWLELVETWKKGCLTIFDSGVVSIYLRGSIPRGLAIEGFSDLDGIVIVRENFVNDDTLENCLAQFHQQLRSQFSFCPNIETQIISEKEIFDYSSGWGILLKIQGLCIWGVDYESQLPPVSLGLDLVSYSFSLAQDINSVCQWMRQNSFAQNRDVNTIKNKCSWLCRRIVRSGFELVMKKENVYTRDLYLNYVVFARYFPERQQDMNRALFLAINPSGNRAGLLVFWGEFGTWLTEKIEMEFNLKYC